MRDFQTKANAGGAPDTISPTRFGAGEFNSIAVELENAVSTSGQTLAPSDGTGEISNQLARALSIYGAGGAMYYADSGAVNAYVLSTISPKIAPSAYFDGFTVMFEPGTVNTGPSTVNVASLGVKTITLQDGSALTGGEIAGTCTIKYSLSNDRFEILFNSYAVSGLSPIYVIDASQADQGAASTNPDTLTIFDAAALIGTSKSATLYLKHNPIAGNTTLFTFDTSLNLTAYPNLKLKMDQGAEFNRTTGDEIFTIYLSSNLILNERQKITSVDMIAFSAACDTYPELWGAIPDAVTDCTNAIQYAVNAAKAGGTIYFSKGTYYLTDTVEGLANQRFFGKGVNNTIFYRDTDYGDTLHFVNSGSLHISGIWFRHGTFPAPVTTLADIVTTGSHINIDVGQGVLIERCWLWRMINQIKIAQGSIFDIRNCNMQGIWNGFDAGGQEGNSSIFIGSGGVVNIVKITNCYIGGADSGAHTVPFTISDNGVQNVNFTATNAGAQYGILVFSCEGLVISENYIGGQYTSSILLSANNTLSNVRISDNFFDGAGYSAPTIYIDPQSDGQIVTLANITNNTFNGELYALTAIGSINSFGIQPVLTAFQINGNTITANIGTAMLLRRLQGGCIEGNAITGYNSRNLTPGGDNNYSQGIYLIDSTSVDCIGNIIGGAVNSAAPSAYTYGEILLGGTIARITVKNNLMNGTGTSGIKNGKQDGRIVIISANYVMDGSEDIIGVDTSSVAVQVTLPSNLPDGFRATFKDITGQANTRNITLVGTIDGAVNLVMSTNYQRVELFHYNGAWYK